MNKRGSRLFFIDSQPLMSFGFADI